MGLLDDAIREHLDLKRRRGADADEVARQEDEALGPPRTREFATPADTTAIGDDLEPVVPEPPPEPVFADPQEDEPDLPEATGDRPAAVAASRAEEPPTRTEFTDEEAWLDDEPEAEPPERAEPSDAGEPAPPGAEATGEEDVLEETPDFLQETPEHERLWFEQRPPRDFDFDK
jgi:hypothetical protein